MTTDIVHVAKSVSMCQVCNHHNVKWKCEECSIYMCNDCKKEIHPRIRSSDTHIISSITDFGKNICYEDQPWYHGNITHTEAVNLLQKLKQMGDGTFLVRDSKSNIGSFTIEFLRGGEPIQIQILSTEKYGKMKYYVGRAQFDGLNDIIQFYKSNMIVHRVMLKEPVLQETYF
ncbi:PLCG1 [Mytilus edulis]|uniref:PLCG1 n=1 Tax=Mytilus edulis TaxID=6550 RepID=A0A8S3QTE4_MYTED|nr:PLCG1 [Mytilus edulis]